MSLALQKLYGRDVANTATVIELFHKILGKYPAEKVIRAFEIWLERSQEFPTPADIIGLIKRNGKPPLSKERYISISKKDGEDRTRDDWQYLREYEAEQDEESMGSDYEEPLKQRSMVDENLRLRKEVEKLTTEVERLGAIIHEERKQRGTEKPTVSESDKILRTIETMKATGAKQEDIAAFATQHGVETPVWQAI